MNDVEPPEIQTILMRLPWNLLPFPARHRKGNVDLQLDGQEHAAETGEVTSEPPLFLTDAARQISTSTNLQCRLGALIKWHLFDLLGPTEAWLQYVSILAACEDSKVLQCKGPSCV